MKIEDKLKKYLNEASFKEKRGDWKNEKVFLFGVEGEPITYEFVLSKGKISKLIDESPMIDEEDLEDLDIGMNKQAYLLLKQDSGQPVKKSEFFSSIEDATKNLIKSNIKGKAPLILYTFGEDIDKVKKGIQSSGKRKSQESGDLTLFI